MKILHVVVLTIVVLGALNWGSVGLFQYDAVAGLLGWSSRLTQTIYVLFGAAGLALVFTSAALHRSVQRAPYPGRVGRQDGAERGPEAGAGAVVHDSSGTHDFDGLPGDALPPGHGGERDDADPTTHPSTRHVRNRQ